MIAIPPNSDIARQLRNQTDNQVLNEMDKLSPDVPGIKDVSTYTKDRLKNVAPVAWEDLPPADSFEDRFNALHDQWSKVADTVESLQHLDIGERQIINRCKYYVGKLSLDEKAIQAWEELMDQLVEVIRLHETDSM